MGEKEHEQRQRLPSTNELVICQVTRVLDYGAFAELVEYGNAKGFIHISQVSSGWIKNIRNYVKEGQLRAASVLAINTEKNQIDLSLTKVPEEVETKKLEEFRAVKRSRKLLEQLASQQKQPFEKVWASVAEPLIEEYGSLFEAFLEIASRGKEAASKVDRQFLEPLLELVKKNISIPQKTINGTLSLQTIKPNGVELIKGALQKGISASKEAEVEVYYSGGGKYALKVTSTDFKVAERVMKTVSGEIIKSIEATGGSGEFKRIN